MVAVTFIFLVVSMYDMEFFFVFVVTLLPSKKKKTTKNSIWYTDTNKKNKSYSHRFKF
jgi:hypothetical protein